MNYRTTRIYVRALELIDFVAHVLRRQPSGYAFLADQLRRAASSVPLNYLEGCGRAGVAERRRFFQIAIGSAHEVAGTLDVMYRFGILDGNDRATGQDLCDHLAAMLRRFR
jgi:four helix bundle protein